MYRQRLRVVEDVHERLICVPLSTVAVRFEGTDGRLYCGGSVAVFEYPLNSVSCQSRAHDIYAVAKVRPVSA